jgi:hypothetical protein
MFHPLIGLLERVMLWMGRSGGMAKVFLALSDLRAYYQPCLVNRLWVPTTVCFSCFPDGGKLQGYS